MSKPEPIRRQLAASTERPANSSTFEEYAKQRRKILRQIIRKVTGELGPMPRYDGAIMMSRTQIALDPEIQRRARQRANDMGVSLAEYVRRRRCRQEQGR